RVVVDVDDVVQVPPVRLRARRRGEGRLVARLAGVVAEDREGLRRLAFRLARGPAGQPVAPEPVLGTVRRGDAPVLAVVVAVGRAGEPLDAGTVVRTQVPEAVAVPDQLARVAIQGEDRVVGGPALVAGSGGVVGRAAHVLATGLVPALDE